jgi:hypothetical protein
VRRAFIAVVEGDPAVVEEIDSQCVFDVLDGVALDGERWSVERWGGEQEE